MLTDPIADLLTRIRNGYMAGNSLVLIPHSEIKYAIAKIIEKNKFIANAELSSIDGKKAIAVTLLDLKKNQTQPNFKRMSKPGRRMYVKSEDIKPVNSGFGIGILSTPKGILTHFEAKKEGIGGEYLCQIY